MKQNDKVKVTKTGEVGYVEKISDGGERVTVCIPASEGWPFPHYVYVAREGVVYLNDKTNPKAEPKSLDWRAPF